MQRLRSLLYLFVFALIGLQVFFALRIVAMRWINPESTSFQRSAIERMFSSQRAQGLWKQGWVPESQISQQLKRAVIASEDSLFTEHDGVDWRAIEAAWRRNHKAQRAVSAQALGSKPEQPIRLVGGSTITQQLAKNLFLSSDRSFLRKGQELLIALMLEASLSKKRILEIYLNNVEWGRNVFGIQAAAAHYFDKSAKSLSARESARLAVMLPRPRYYEHKLNTAFLSKQGTKIQARMPAVDLP